MAQTDICNCHDKKLNIRPKGSSISMYLNILSLGAVRGSIGNGQGLINSTMSISQGIRMMHNNSMAREKENMQINTASPMTN
ncbi:hypothetical protein KY284_003706 [Solanum tuberosum]|nr:hypothetical protein KY284_003706 [Solanum tuberosum]